MEIEKWGFKKECWVTLSGIDSYLKISATFFKYASK